MTPARMHEIGTMGGCGEIARRLFARVGGVPHLRYDAEGSATHAAIMVGGRLIHFGEDDGLVVATVEQLRAACEIDFDASRVCADESDYDAIADLLAAEIVG